MGRETKKSRYMYNWFTLHLKLTQHCKSIILNFFKLKSLFYRSKFRGNSIQYQTNANEKRSLRKKWKSRNQSPNHYKDEKNLYW